MGTGQTLLTIGAVVLLGSVILTTNRNISNSKQLMLQTNMQLEEVSYASSIIQKAEGLYYDENCKSDTVQVTNPVTGFTPAASLGYDNGDPNDLDDVDDFNGAPSGSGRLWTDSLSTGVYHALTQVHYCYVDSLDSSSPIPTFQKRLDVEVWNENQIDQQTGAPDTLQMSSVISYWAF